MTSYDDGGYFLLGVNPQILLERLKDKNELVWCASAFLERIVQINLLEEYFGEFQIVRSLLENIASHMCEELSEGYFLEHFIAGLEEGRRSYVKWLLQRTVDDARIYAKHYRAKPFAKCYPEETIITKVITDPVDSVDSYVNVVDNDCEIGLTSNDFEVQVEENSVDVDCCFGENISQIKADVSSILKADAISKLVIVRTGFVFGPGVVVAHIVHDPFSVECEVIVDEDDTVRFARMEGINSRNDWFTKKGQSTLKHAKCLIKVPVVITEGLLPLGSLIELLWDPRGYWKHREPDLGNFEQVNVTYAKCLRNAYVTFEQKNESYGKSELMHVQQVMEVLLETKLFQIGDTVLKNDSPVLMQNEEFILLGHLLIEATMEGSIQSVSQAYFWDPGVLSKSKCLNSGWTLQGHKFKTKKLFLFLEGFDVVLEVKLLELYGPVSMDVKKELKLLLLRMEKQPDCLKVELVNFHVSLMGFFSVEIIGTWVSIQMMIWILA